VPKGTTVTNEHDLDCDDDGWFVSSFSNGKGSCVQIKFVAGATLVGDSKDTRAAAPVISMPSPGWNSFLSNIHDLAQPHACPTAHRTSATQSNPPRSTQAVRCTHTNVITR